MRIVSTEKFMELCRHRGFLRVSRHSGYLFNVLYYTENPPGPAETLREMCEIKRLLSK